MGKRSNFERIERDFYPTPYEAVIPLLKHLPDKSRFIEPCAGDGRLIRHLEGAGHECVFACDIEPQAGGIEKRDVLFFNYEFPDRPHCDFIITNPPWERSCLHAMIFKFTAHAPSWLLFDSDWAYTGQSKPFSKLCSKIIPVGRVKWIEGSKNSGMDNASWYLFDSRHSGKTEFIF